MKRSKRINKKEDWSDLKTFTEVGFYKRNGKDILPHRKGIKQ